LPFYDETGFAGKTLRVKVTHVSLRPTEAADRAGRPALTPELLAASGARYSRNNEGLESILSKIDPSNLDKSVDGIFKMIDYGHQSIADMTPVSMFIDGVSMWLAYLIWSWCPTAGGQESSTRYIKMDASSLLDLELADEWRTAMEGALAVYEQALVFWEEIGLRQPERTRIPRELREDPSDKAQRKVQRMMRNYAFDRARYFLPVGLKTNVMLLMSARAWAGLCQRLLSHALPEAQALGSLVAGELELAAPRLLRHATAKESFHRGLLDEFEDARFQARATNEHLEGQGSSVHPSAAYLEVYPPESPRFTEGLAHHDNRYAYFGLDVQRTAVRFGWRAVTFAEIRDLNRHRTGSKYCPPCPVGFYCAEDEVPSGEKSILAELRETGKSLTRQALERLRAGDSSSPYWCLLGSQFPFEHVTTADKYLYEAELRTGTGAHYRYAEHLSETLELWYERFPETKGMVLEGSAEPE
jgi:thymidylate synthase ThyX